MSSIPSGPPSQDSIARLQAQHAEKDRDKDLRHREQLQDLKTDQKVEIDRIRKQSFKRIEQVQNESAAKLNERDLQHQKEIDSIKDIYNKRLADFKKGE